MLYKRKDGRVWWFEFWYCGRRYRGSTRTSSERLAQRIERKRRQNIEAAGAGIVLEPVRPVLLSVAADDWLKLKEPMVSAKTYEMYSADVTRLKPRFGKLLVTDITDRHVADYITTRRTKGIADKSIRNELGTLRGILRKHKRWDAIKENIRLPRGREDVGRAISAKDEEGLLAACAASRSRSLLPAVSLALSTGMRHDEIRLLRWRQVDFTHTALTVGKAKTAHSTGRVIPLNQRAIAALRTWAEQFPDRKPGHYVFPSEMVGIAGDDEIAVSYEVDPTKPILSWKTSWTTARTAAGVLCRFHDLRHTTCTRLLEKGAPFAAVAAIMGWSPGTVMKMAKRYAHIGPSVQRAALALLDPTPDPSITARTDVDTTISTPAGGTVSPDLSTVH